MLKHYKRTFDFEIGYLIKSPCRECLEHGRFPACMHDCEILDRVQRILSETVSCTRLKSSMEGSALAQHGWGR